MQLQIFRRVVDDLAVGARRVRQARQRRAAAEPDRRRERIRLRRAVRQRHGRGTEARIRRGKARDERTDITAGLNHVARADADVERRVVLTRQTHGVRPIGRPRLASASIEGVVIAVAEELR